MQAERNLESTAMTLTDSDELRKMIQRSQKWGIDLTTRLRKHHAFSLLGNSKYRDSIKTETVVLWEHLNAFMATALGTTTFVACEKLSKKE